MLRTNQLVALKAFYLGRKIESASKVYLAQPAITEALKRLSERRGHAERIREMFYLLLMAEMYRGKDTCLEYRKRAKDLDDQCSLDIYTLYMKIEDATQSRVHVAGLGGGDMSHPIIHNKRGATFTQDWFGPIAFWDYAIAALDLDDSHLSKRDTHFLHSVSLQEILTSHNLA